MRLSLSQFFINTYFQGEQQMCLCVSLCQNGLRDCGLQQITQQCIIMGLCSCCPFSRDRKSSVDSLSMATQNPSLQVELPVVAVRGKRLKDSQLTLLKRQESIYFKQSHRLKLDEETLHAKVIPLIAPKHHNHLTDPSAPIKFQLKEKLRPQLQKGSTMDQDTSHENHFNNRDDFEDSEQEESLSQEQHFQGKGDMTFSGRAAAVVMGRQFMTNQQSPKAVGKEEMGKLQERLKEENIGAQERSEILFKMGKHFCQKGEYPKSQQFLEQSIELHKDVGSLLLKFETFSLLGYVLLLREMASEAVSYLLKAIRLQVARSGVQSVRLVEAYYWLGQAYLRSRRGSLAKEYLLKAHRGYNFHALQDPQLLQNIHLQLGMLYHSQEEFPEADKHYARGVKVAENSGRGDKYLRLLLARAENFYAMENYRNAVGTFATAFKWMRRHNLTETQIFNEARESLRVALKNIVQACISENELMNVIKSAEECVTQCEEMKELKERLKKMREILYRQ